MLVNRCNSWWQMSSSQWVKEGMMQSKALPLECYYTTVKCNGLQGTCCRQYSKASIYRHKTRVLSQQLASLCSVVVVSFNEVLYELWYLKHNLMANTFVVGIQCLILINFMLIKVTNSVNVWQKTCTGYSTQEGHQWDLVNYETDGKV